MSNKSWFARVDALTRQLLAQPSITNSPAEQEFAAFLHNLLAQQPYFAQNPQYLRTVPIANDPYGRSNVYALVHGGPRTVILAGHYDVVSIDNYGEFAPYAFDPDPLREQLIADLQQNANSESARQALRDLLSGDFLAGRGALDMKCGVAQAIALLEHAAETKQLQGSLLLIATPDEEQASYGMRGVAEQLPALCAEWGIDPLGAINLDVTGDLGDGSIGRAVFWGSVGKLLPSVYIVGHNTHAGAPFEGLNSTLLSAEITRHVECNPDLTDQARGEFAAPPVCLKQTDLKNYYDVTTPAASWSYYNTLMYSWSPSEVLRRFRIVVEQALQEAVDQQRQRAEIFAQRSKTPLVWGNWQPKVYEFAELQRIARERDPQAYEQTLAALEAQIPSELDLPSYSMQLTDAIWKLSGLKGPAAVIGIAAIYYPRVQVDASVPKHAEFEQVLKQAISQFSDETGISIAHRPFFNGISDMSFLGSQDSASEIDLVAANTPAWQRRIKVNYHALSDLALPVVNLGAWGRDYHQRYERVYTPYAFEQVPDLLWRILSQLIGK